MFDTKERDKCLVICVYFDVLPDDEVRKFLTCPRYGQCLFLDLCIVLYHV